MDIGKKHSELIVGKIKRIVRGNAIAGTLLCFIAVLAGCFQMSATPAWPDLLTIALENAIDVRLIPGGEGQENLLLEPLASMTSVIDTLLKPFLLIMVLLAIVAALINAISTGELSGAFKMISGAMLLSFSFLFVQNFVGAIDDTGSESLSEVELKPYVSKGNVEGYLKMVSKVSAPGELLLREALISKDSQAADKLSEIFSQQKAFELAVGLAQAAVISTSKGKLEMKDKAGRAAAFSVSMIGVNNIKVEDTLAFALYQEGQGFDSAIVNPLYQIMESDIRAKKKVAKASLIVSTVSLVIGFLFLSLSGLARRNERLTKRYILEYNSLF